MAFVEEWGRSAFTTRYRFWFVGFQSGARENTAVVRKHRYWSNYMRYELATVTSVLRAAPTSPVEIEIVQASGVKYAGMIELTLGTISCAAELVRKSQTTSFILVSSRVGRASGKLLRSLHDKLMESSSREYESMNWTTVAGEMCALGDGVIRAAGNFDDREASIDLFVSPCSELGALVRSRT